MKKIKFKQFIKLQRGFDLPRKDMKKGPIPVVGSTKIIGFHNEYKKGPPGVIMGRSGTLGFIQLINEKYWPHNTTLWVKDFKGNYPNYVYYFLKTINLAKFNSGASVPTLNRNFLDNLDIRIHSIFLQKKIASILSAYDDLIENNNRRIEILEEMAQAIYKEWFIRFRFPGHEKVKMVNSELGKIPEGWKVVEVGKRFSTLLGGTPSKIKDEYWAGGNIPWINSGKVNELRVIDESEFITELGLRKSSTKMMPKRTTVVAITGATLGQVSLLEIEACANQSVVGIYDTEHLFDEYIYFKFCEIIRSVISKSSGGAQQHINKEIVNSEKILTPSINIILKFNKVICPICNLIRNLLIKNKILKKTRDVLLPKLISGEINVENLDIKTEDDIK
jgi:type I restriction enzyme S subunit